jgi:hypothetical protein
MSTAELQKTAEDHIHKAMIKVLLSADRALVEDLEDQIIFYASLDEKAFFERVVDRNILARRLVGALDLVAGHVGDQLLTPEEAAAKIMARAAVEAAACVANGVKPNTARNRLSEVRRQQRADGELA